MVLRHIIFSLLVLVLLTLAACGEEPTPASTRTPTVTAVTPTATSRPQPTATATIPPTPTPIRPAITVEDQTIDENGRLLIAEVTVPEAAWIVIHAERDGQVGEVLGYTAVAVGRNTAVEVVIDPLAATEDLTAIIHEDAGVAGEFEFPGTDEPLLNETGTAVSQSFAIERDMPLPAVNATAQAVAEDGLVRLDSVYSPGPGWVVIHAEEDGGIGPILGHTFVVAGESTNVVVHIPWRQGTPMLYAMLHEDNGRANRFDFPDDDLPVLVAGEPVVTPIQATYPPDVYVLDQPVVEGGISIERVISIGPGWLVIYQDNGEGRPGLIIGSAALADGLNEQVRVPVQANNVTDQLFIFLHEDTEPGDSFNFPAADPQITYQGRIPNPFSFLTAPGNYLVTKDQALGESENGATAVTIPFTVSDLTHWVAIYADAEGQLGEIIGQTWLPPGVNRNVLVEIDRAQVTPTLYAVLHLDAGVAEEFEPAGADVRLQRNRNIIQAPFSIVNGQ
jgi:hypothetical protein